MKSALPMHAKLSKESKVCIQECVSEFISFITSQAIDKCKLEKRKTLNGEDILWAMYTLGFENYSETLKIYLAKYREFEQREVGKKLRQRTRKEVNELKDDFEPEKFLMNNSGVQESQMERHVFDSTGYYDTQNFDYRE